MSFALNEDCQKKGIRSIRALIEHASSESANVSEPIFVIINSRTPLTRKKEYIPRIIKLSHKLDKLSNKSVLLVTKDPSTPYRHALTEKGSPTEDTFDQIYTLTKLKNLSKDPKKLTKCFKEFDLVVADNRVHKFLPDILGGQFYIKNKKLPFMVQMAKPDPNAKLTRASNNKLKDDRCEPKYIQQQMKVIAENTFFHLTSKGTCMSIKVGYTSWKPQQVMENINDVLLYLTDTKYAPVGGQLKENNIHSVNVKTSESISLPVMEVVDLGLKEEEYDSDFDF
ncbi:uncharacterized protein KQ657_002003 [Scheffersomyces spartinae]|uniref:Ribosome biogenesis protein UTP30 n=1 Tax=Scheffersomyces spartinae TaxID=45513 RepID=A0A9P8AHL7_9ASCO|nr:uncharacterized protein KQ657_002003 [Scheffersomyces spartinae]KAG7192284.1 hypothetical protein KQ657_002003 [Scheffersomyces spartinae]